MQFSLASQLVHELRSSLSGYPRFVFSGDTHEAPHHVPVFVYHTVNPTEFEEDLKFLRENEYRTVGVDDLYAHLTGQVAPLDRAVVLTFDDGRSSFWRYAFPLLQKYEMRAVVFVIPGFTSDTDRRRPNLTDVWAGRCSLADLSTIDPHDTSLCSWIELATMHQTGLIDVESHSLFHGEVFDDLQIKDFLLPDSSFAPFETSMTAYLEPRDAASRPSHESYYGLPIFSTTPLYAGVPGWRADEDLIAKARSLYAEAGKSSNYNLIRAQLRRLWDDIDLTGMLYIQTQEQVQEAIWLDLLTARSLIKAKVSPASGDHFCLPYTVGSELSTNLMREHGIKSCFWGISLNRKYNNPGNDPLKIVRVKSDFLYRLPGCGQRSLAEVYLKKVARRLRGDRVY